MPCIYCEICDQMIDLDYDVEHEEECKQDQDYRMKELENKIMKGRQMTNKNKQLFQIMPELDIRKTHLRASEWLFDNQSLVATEVYINMQALEKDAREFLATKGYK